MEERTGLGGGFNERGVVEYKQRQDSDDEFDDFGRRKKKYRKELQTPAGPKYKAEQEEEEEDEDEDEDDDDDDDLSKYDLWGNEEAGTKEETQPSKPKSNSPKRSRSKSRSRNRNKRSRRCDFYDTWKLRCNLNVSVPPVQAPTLQGLEAEVVGPETGGDPRDPVPGSEEGKVEEDTRAPLAAAHEEAQGQGTVKWRN